MTTILIIICACWILYKTGAAGGFLECFRLYEPETVTESAVVAPVTKVTAAPETRQETREDLEASAHYILTARGYEYPETVDSMPDALLVKIIREYTDI